MVLPDDAVVGDVSAQRPGAGSLPTSVKLDPDGPKGHYSFNFPIQPDEGGKGTLFQIQYEAAIRSSKYTFHSVVTLPAQTVLGGSAEVDDVDRWKRYGFRTVSAGSHGADFTDARRGAGQADRVHDCRHGIVSARRPGQRRGGHGDNGAAQAGAPGNQPGGGIGQPINTPDPLSKYKWWILGGSGSAAG